MEKVWFKKKPKKPTKKQNIHFVHSFQLKLLRNKGTLSWSPTAKLTFNTVACITFYIRYLKWNLYSVEMLRNMKAQHLREKKKRWKNNDCLLNNTLPNLLNIFNVCSRL